MWHPVRRPAASAPLWTDSHNSFPVVRGITAIVRELEDRQPELSAQSATPSSSQQMEGSLANQKHGLAPRRPAPPGILSLETCCPNGSAGPGVEKKNRRRPAGMTRELIPLMTACPDLYSLRVPHLRAE